MNHADPTIKQHSGSKYLREVVGAVDGRVDVYAVIETFAVACPARQHAIKKLLCSGLRGKGDALQDLREAGDAITRAIEIETQRVAARGEERKIRFCDACGFQHWGKCNPSEVAKKSIADRRFGDTVA